MKLIEKRRICQESGCECEEVTEGEGEHMNALTVEAYHERIHVMSPWMRKAGESTCIRSVIDSGAVDSVAPATIAPNVEVKEPAGSRRGQNYLFTSGGIIPK